MALGGGTFAAMNKVLPGTYIRYIKVSETSSLLSNRGVVAMPLALHWGPENEVFEIKATDFEKNAKKYFGYDSSASELKGIRDVFKHGSMLYVYRLNDKPVKATSDYGTAKYGGVRGNDITVTVSKNVDNTSAYDVVTRLGNVVVDEQTGITAVNGLKDNDYVIWNRNLASLTETAGTTFAGGTDGEMVTGERYTAAFEAFESYSFNVLGVMTSDSTIKALATEYTKRMRENYGKVFQTVLHKYNSADYEGVISVDNDITDVNTESASMVYWVSGICAGCKINTSNQNLVYDGEFKPTTSYTQAALEEAISAGKFVLHNVNGTMRVLADINTLQNVGPEKNDEFKENKTIRIIDQDTNDTAALFNSKYLGSVPNDNAGRISLWSDLVNLAQEMQKLGAIENFSASDITVSAGDTKKSVVVSKVFTVAGTMSQLYATVVIQ